MKYKLILFMTLLLVIVTLYFVRSNELTKACEYFSLRHTEQMRDADEYIEILVKKNANEFPLSDESFKQVSLEGINVIVPSNLGENNSHYISRRDNDLLQHYWVRWFSPFSFWTHHLRPATKWETYLEAIYFLPELDNLKCNSVSSEQVANILNVYDLSVGELFFSYAKIQYYIFEDQQTVLTIHKISDRETDRWKPFNGLAVTLAGSEIIAFGFHHSNEAIIKETMFRTINNWKETLDTTNDSEGDEI